MAKISALYPPESVEESIADIMNHYKRHLDVIDADLATDLQMTKLFKQFSERYKERNEIDDKEYDSSDEEDPDCPGRTI